MRTVLRLAWLLLLILAGCAHAPRLLSAGTAAVQRERVRPVFCLTDADMPRASCEVDLAAAIESLNVATGRELLRFAGTVTDAATLKELWKERALVVMAGDLNPELTLAAELAKHPIPGVTAVVPDSVTLGVTAWHASVFRSLLDVAIVLDVRLFQAAHAGKVNTRAIMRHELMHAVGFQHSELGPLSIMAPNYQPNVLDYTAADIAALRAVYGD